MFVVGTKYYINFKIRPYDLVANPDRIPYKNKMDMVTHSNLTKNAKYWPEGLDSQLPQDPGYYDTECDQLLPTATAWGHFKVAAYHGKTGIFYTELVRAEPAYPGIPDAADEYKIYHIIASAIQNVVEESTLYEMTTDYYTPPPGT